MSPHSSSTSSSSGGRWFGDIARVLGWTLLWLVVIDIAFNVIFRFPQDPKVVNASTLRQYFEYGRSAEGKLRRMTRPSRDDTAPITLAGWYDPLVMTEVGDPAAAHTMTIYGMSHANRLGAAVGRVNKSWKVRRISAPGAPMNWSYGAYLRDTGKNTGSVAVLAIMSVNVPQLTSTTPATFAPDLQIPYTYDRFVPAGDHLDRIKPPYESFEGYTESFYSPAKWDGYRQFLAANDSFYKTLVFRESVFDHSAIFRLLRRAAVQHSQNEVQSETLGRSGFDAGSEAIRAANLIIEGFAADAKRQGLIPAIFVVNNLGYSDTLRRALEPAIHKTGIVVLDSHAIANANDARNYLPDSHFTDSVDDRLALELIRLVEEASRK